MTTVEDHPLIDELGHLGLRRYSDLVRPDGMVHRALFTDAAIFETEMQKVFGGSWVFLAHETEIPNANDYKLVNIGRRPVIVTRDRDGVLRALLNRCTHRGSLICVKERGNAGKFQCPYHGWTFNNNGDLASVTFASGYGPNFNNFDHNLGQFPKVESYRGYVFGSLNPGVEALTDWIGPARDVLDWSIDQTSSRGVRVVRANSMVFHGNWKLQNDNNGDMYHVPFTHKSTLIMTSRRHGGGKSLDHFRGDDSPMFVMNLGHGHKLIDQRPSMGSRWERARPVPGREFAADAVRAAVGDELAEEYLEMTGRGGINLVMYPNLMLSGCDGFNVYEPVTVNRTRVNMYVGLIDDVPAEVNTLRMRFQEDFINVGNRDDNELFERIQETLETIPEMEWVDFSKGLGTDHEVTRPDGAIVGNIADETGIRGSYMRWRELMDADVSLSVRR